jgi:hypothetical protein
LPKNDNNIDPKFEKFVKRIRSLWEIYLWSSALNKNCLSFPIGAIEILELEQVCLHWYCKYFFGKEYREKKLADLQPRQGNLLQRSNFQGSTKPLFTPQNT